MSWKAPILLVLLSRILVCRGSRLVTANETDRMTTSKRVSIGLCNFKDPRTDRLEDCSGDMSNFNRCTCATNGVYTFCSSRGLSNVPQTPSVVRVLLLDHNYISVVNFTSFQNSTNLLYLDLSYNNISTIRSNAFTRLHKLETLLLHHNKLCYKYIEGHLLYIDFSKMANLKCMRIEQNTNYENNTVQQIPSMQSLQKLHTLYMNGIQGWNFNHEFLNLTNLRDLVLNGIDGYCNISRIEKETFGNLSQISGLSIINCNLSFVDNKGFSGLRNLRSLNLSHNEGLHFKGLRNITYSLINLTEFEWLNLTKIHSAFGKCAYIDSYMFQYINQTTVSKLILDINRLSDVSPDAVNYLPKTLTYLSLNKNKLDVGLYFINVICYFKNLFLKLETFVISNQNYRKQIGELVTLFSDKNIWRYGNDTQFSYHFDSNSKVPRIQECFKNIIEDCEGCPLDYVPCPFPELGKKCIYPFPFPMTQNLKTVDFSGSLYKISLENICLCKPNKLINLNISKNIIYSFPGPFYGFDYLQTLDLSDSYCQNITDVSFSSMTNLRTLNLSSNYLGSIINNFTDLLPFQHLIKLEQLDLSNNKLRTLPFHLFSNLYNLRYLSLSENRLSRIEVNTCAMAKLKYINLSGNLIETFSDDIMKTLDVATSQNKLQINLYDNKFICNCKYENFIEWIVKNKKMFVKFEKYYCFFDNGDNVLLSDKEILNRLGQECADYMTLILVTSFCVGITLIGIISALLYRYRWRIRYMYYSAKLRYKGYSRVDEHDHFQYDLFVSYADTDKDFVRESMIPELEENRGLKLLIHERDFPFGQQVIENIHNAISSSRKTLLLISHGFLQSKWCKYEMNIAKIEEIKRDREVLCVVIKEPIHDFKLPAEVTEIIAKNTYLTVPNNQEDLERFWDTIKCAFVQNMNP